MKRILLVGVLALFVPQTTLAQTAAEDSAAIRAAALDYIEGWWTGDSVRMGRAIHPELAKRAVFRSDSGESRLGHATAEGMIRATSQGRGTGLFPEERATDVAILDLFGDIATVRLVSTQLVDYLHLLRWDGEWKIVNVLWASRPPLDLEVEPSALAGYIGEYTYGSGDSAGDLRVFSEGGRLMAQGARQPFRLLYQGNHIFVPAVESGMRIAFTLQDGRADGFYIREGGRSIRAVRKGSGH